MDSHKISEVLEFVGKPVPPPYTESFNQWEVEAKKINKEHIPVLITILGCGTVSEQYSALVCLRVLGELVHATGYGSELKYCILEKGRKLYVHPRITSEM